MGRMRKGTVSGEWQHVSSSQLLADGSKRAVPVYFIAPLPVRLGEKKFERGVPGQSSENCRVYGGS